MKKRVCSECGDKAKYAPKHDMFGCPKCRQWVEKQMDCGDTKCSYCPSPKRPPVGTVWE